MLQYCQFDHLPHLQTMGEGCISTKLRNTRPAHIQQLGSAAMLSQKMEPQISINVIILANRCMEYKIMASNAWRLTFPLTVHLSQKKAVTQMLTKKQCSRERKRLGIRHFSSLGLVRTMLAQTQRSGCWTEDLRLSIENSGSTNYQSVLAQTCIEANRPFLKQEIPHYKFHACEI